MEFKVRKTYTSQEGVAWDLVYNNGQIQSYRNRNCYALFPNTFVDVDKIILYNFDCELTKDYRDFYLQYIIDMLKLDATFDDKSFTYKAFQCRAKNLLVGALVRILWEKMFAKYEKNHEWILQPLSKSKSKNKLQAFCRIYQKITIDEKYLATGHLWTPSLTKVKTQKEWLESESIPSVTGFFTK